MWACDTCTYAQNGDDKAACEICGNPRAGVAVTGGATANRGPSALQKRREAAGAPTATGVAAPAPSDAAAGRGASDPLISAIRDAAAIGSDDAAVAAASAPVPVVPRYGSLNSGARPGAGGAEGSALLRRGSGGDAAGGGGAALLRQAGADDGDDDEAQAFVGRPRRLNDDSVRHRCTACLASVSRRCGLVLGLGPNLEVGGCCLIVALVAALIGLMLLLLSIGAVEPTYYGLRHNVLTGTVDTDFVYESGRHLIGPTANFIAFPACQVVLDFDDRTGAAAPPIRARTGHDPSDQNSGGQPVLLYSSFTYRIPRASVGALYRSFAQLYDQRFLQLASQALSDVSQRFFPEQFWTQRHDIGDAMKRELTAVLGGPAGHGIELVSFQLLRWQFLASFESTIVQIQLAVQARTTSEYRQQVVAVEKQIDIAAASANATCVAIAAKARAHAALIVNRARLDGFNATQTAKAVVFQRLAHRLGLDTTQLMRYLRIRGVRAHKANSLTLGYAARATSDGAEAPKRRSGAARPRATPSAVGSEANADAEPVMASATIEPHGDSSALMPGVARRGGVLLTPQHELD